MDAISVDAPMCPVPRHREAGRDIICLRIMTRATRSIRENIREPGRPRAYFQGYSHRQLFHLSRDISKEYSKFRKNIYGNKGTTMVSLNHHCPKTIPPILVWKVAKFLILVEDSDSVTNVINAGKWNAPNHHT